MRKLPVLKTIAADIRFWILLFFVIRLVGITNPPLDMGHSWRQSMTCMVTRNFYEEGVNMFYPKVDMTGNKTGFIGSEFPLFNYLCYLFCCAFGYAHWYGRLINLVVSGFGIYYFYLLIQKLFNTQTAFCSALVLLSSIWFGFSRKIMPDTFTLSLVIAGLYYGYRYLQSGAWWRLLLFFILGTFGVLCKLPALCLLSIGAVMLIAKEIELRRRIYVSISLAVSFAMIYLWYFQWVPYLVETYACPLFFPRSLIEGLREQIPLAGALLERFYFSALYSYVAFACCVAGVVLLILKGNRYQQLGVLLVTLTFFVFVLKTGLVFPAHNYYIIPFTPVMALLAGYAIAAVQPKYKTLLLMLIVCEGIAWQASDFFVKDSERYKLSLETIAQQCIGKDDLILINSGMSPQEIYFAHRRGWSITGATMMQQQAVDSYIGVGAKYLVVNKKYWADSMLYPVVYSDPNYAIYNLK